MSNEASEYAVDEANAKLLKCWLNGGRWTREQATLLFLEIDPRSVTSECFSTFSGRGEVQYDYYDEDRKDKEPCSYNEDGEPEYLTDEQNALFHKTKQRCFEIDLQLNSRDTAEPREWIELAREKEIHIPWLDWAIKRGHYGQTAEPYADSNEPIVNGSVSESTQWHLLATPAELIAAFGLSTGMNRAWFNALKDKPQLKASRHMVGVGGNRNREPLFNVFPVMQWLINPARRTGRPLGADKGWQLFESHFPRAYAEFSVGDPRTD